jgi:hypothetical protein
LREERSRGAGYAPARARNAHCVRSSAESSRT